MLYKALCIAAMVASASAFTAPRSVRTSKTSVRKMSLKDDEPWFGDAVATNTVDKATLE